LRGDLGTSYLNDQSVTSLILQTLPATLELAILGMALALLLSLPLGIISAYRNGTWIDHFARLLALAGFCIPRYWLAVAHSGLRAEPPLVPGLRLRRP